MKKIILLFIVAVMLTFTMNNKADAVNVADTIQSPTGFFLDIDANKYAAPYYRGINEDWGWSHNAIGTPFTTATLNISAWDVDKASGEIDNIYAWDDGVKTLLGSLDGNDNAWAFTEFTLGNNFFNDIAAGLQVYMEISVGAGEAGWLVTLAKSTLCLDQCDKPNPNPGVVPEPSTYLLLGSGIAGLAFWRRRQKAKKA